MLVMALKEEQAAALLRNMSDGSLSKLRKAAESLDVARIGNAEKRAALQGFLQRQRKGGFFLGDPDERFRKVLARAKGEEGLRQIYGGGAERAPEDEEKKSAQEFIEEALEEQVAAVLAKESIRSAAVLLSKLSGEKAGRILNMLEQDQREAVVERIITSENIPPEVADEIIDGFRQKIEEMGAEGEMASEERRAKELARMIATLDRESQDSEPVQDKIREGDQLRPSVDRKIELYEICARYDADDDGIDEDIMVIWHQRSGTVLRAIHNPFWHGKWPYEVAQYIKTFSLLGKGIASMNEYAQAVASRLLNCQVDNALLANTKVYAGPEGYEYMGPGTTVYPGKYFPLRPGEQLTSIGMSDIYPSTFALLSQLQEWAEARTSVSELRTGNVSGLPSRTPATTVLSLLQEGNKKFDMIMGNLRSGALANIGKRTLQMIAQRHQQGSTRWEKLARDTLGDDADAVVQVLSLEQAAIEEGFGIDVTATSGQVNREVQKQNLVGLAQFYAQAGAQLIQLVQMIGDQQLMMRTALGIYSGGRELMMRLLEAYEIQNPERYVPPPLGPEMQQQAGMGAQPQIRTQFPPGAPGAGISPEQLGALLGIG